MFSRPSFYWHFQSETENLHSYFISYSIMLYIFKINSLWHSVSIFMLNLLFFPRSFLPLGKYTVTFQNYFLGFWRSNFFTLLHIQRSLLIFLSSHNDKLYTHLSSRWYYTSLGGKKPNEQNENSLGNNCYAVLVWHFVKILSCENYQSKSHPL